MDNARAHAPHDLLAPGNLAGIRQPLERAEQLSGVSLVKAGAIVTHEENGSFLLPDPR